MRHTDWVCCSLRKAHLTAMVTDQGVNHGVLGERPTAILRVVSTNPASSCWDALAKGAAVQNAGRKRQYIRTAEYASLARLFADILTLQ